MLGNFTRRLAQPASVQLARVMRLRGIQNTAAGPSQIFVRKTKHLFDIMDVNKDGVLNKEDLLQIGQNFQVYGQLSQEQTQRLQKHFGEWWDYTKMAAGDDSDEFTLEGMIEARFRIQQLGNEEEARNMMRPVASVMFKAIDTDDDGSISKKEWKTFFKAVGIEGSGTAENSFQLIDANRDGEMSFEEFYRCMFEYFYKQEETESMHMFGELP